MSPPQAGGAGDPSGLDAVARSLRACRHLVVLTGAGVSAESGIRTFRDTMEGLWKEFDPATLATPEAFGRDPALVTRWYDHRRLGCLAAEPNAGHLALARVQRELESRGRRFTLLTQNVDRLHQRAGSRDVVELHGSIMEWRCTRTGRPVTPPPNAMEAYPPPSPFDPGGLLRPAVVWFGEELPAGALRAATEAARDADAFWSVGTSARVYPAAGFIRFAAEHGAFTAEINRDATPLTGEVDVALAGPSGTWLPRIAAAAFDPV